MTIDDLIAAHQKQIASLEKIKEAMVSVQTDKAMSLKDVVGHLAGSKHASIALLVTIEQKEAVQIAWTITMGRSWDNDRKESTGPTLVDAYRNLNTPMSNLDKLSEEL